MSDANPGRTGHLYDPALHPELYDSVLSKRIVGFLVDAVIIVILMIPGALIVGVIGIVTFGIGFVLFPALFAIVALSYLAFTLGGSRSATVGMNLVGLTMRTMRGDRVFPMLAVVHGLLFWFSISILTPLILLVGLFLQDRRLLHDLIVGTVVLDRSALQRMESQPRATEGYTQTIDLEPRPEP